MYICLCNAITERAIIRAAEEGARSPEDLTHALGVGLGCGSCLKCAKALLAETVARMSIGDCKTSTGGTA
jgi:bacterioferritin-associated ferredoxin